MSRPRTFLIGGLLLGLLLLLVGMIGGKLTPWVADQVKSQFPLPATWGPSRWSWPIGVALQGLAVADPRGSKVPPFLEVKEVTVQVPWWGFFFRPVPAHVSLLRPHVRIDTKNIDALRDLYAQKMGRSGFFQGPGRATAPSRTSVIGLNVLDGRIDFTDQAAEPERPLFSIGHLSIKAGATALLGAPAIEMVSSGDFVDPVTGEPIGSVKANSRIQPTLGYMEGKVQIWHGRLRDLRNIYYYAPQPFFLEAGAGGPILEWKITGGNHVWVSMRSMTQGLRIDGMVGQIPWNAILKAMEDPDGKLDITVTVEGRLDDPTFEIHDRLLSELDWAFKERCAAGGLLVPTRIFFGLDKPPLDEDGDFKNEDEGVRDEDEERSEEEGDEPKGGPSDEE